MTFNPTPYNYTVKKGILAFQKQFLSNWFGAFEGQKADFWIGGIKYGNVERWMMSEKARLFNDEESEIAILTEPNPKINQQQGRAIKNFDQAIWDEEKYKIVLHGVLNKFDQNQDLKELLISTAPLTICEAAPWDKVWGTGTGPDDERTYNQETWLGENLLGKALMEAREILSKNG